MSTNTEQADKRVDEWQAKTSREKINIIQDVLLRDTQWRFAFGRHQNNYESGPKMVMGSSAGYEPRHGCDVIVSIDPYCVDAEKAAAELHIIADWLKRKGQEAIDKSRLQESIFFDCPF